MKGGTTSKRKRLVRKNEKKRLEKDGRETNLRNGESASARGSGQMRKTTHSGNLTTSMPSDELRNDGDEHRDGDEQRNEF
jgi:hypothetical protein